MNQRFGFSFPTGGAPAPGVASRRLTRRFLQLDSAAQAVPPHRKDRRRFSAERRGRDAEPSGRDRDATRRTGRAFSRGGGRASRLPSGAAPPRTAPAPTPAARRRHGPAPRLPQGGQSRGPRAPARYAAGCCPPSSAEGAGRSAAPPAARNDDVAARARESRAAPGRSRAGGAPR